MSQSQCPAGHEIYLGEQFCGACGLPVSEGSTEMQELQQQPASGGFFGIGPGNWISPSPITNRASRRVQKRPQRPRLLIPVATIAATALIGGTVAYFAASCSGSATELASPLVTDVQTTIETESPGGREDHNPNTMVSLDPTGAIESPLMPSGSTPEYSPDMATETVKQTVGPDVGSTDDRIDVIEASIQAVIASYVNGVALAFSNNDYEYLENWIEPGSPLEATQMSNTLVAEIDQELFDFKILDWHRVDGNREYVEASVEETYVVSVPQGRRQDVFNSTYLIHNDGNVWRVYEKTAETLVSSNDLD